MGEAARPAERGGVSATEARLLRGEALRRCAGDRLRYSLVAREEMRSVIEIRDLRGYDYDQMIDLWKNGLRRMVGLRRYAALRSKLYGLYRFKR